MSVFRRTKSDPTQLQIVRNLRECPGCGLFQRLPDLTPGHLARCPRCECRLERNNTNSSIVTPIALTVSSAVLYLLAITQPLLSLDIYGRSRTISLFSGPLELVREGWAPVGLLVMLATVIFPAIVIWLMLTITISVVRGQTSPLNARRLRWYGRLRSWSMIEVYILGVFVAYSKLIDLAQVGIGYAVYAIGGLMLTMATTDATIRTDFLWRRQGITRAVAGDMAEAADQAQTDADDDVLPPPWKMVACTACGLVCSTADPLGLEAPVGPCPRCRQTLRRRKPDSLRRTLALLVAATILYVPANLLPIMTIIKLYRGGGYTIVGGAIELYQDGMLPLALLVFFASITVPVLKILSLGLMVLGTWRHSATRLVDRSKLYRVVEFIGRWSMIDVFMVSILVGLVRFGILGHITANAGVEFFAAVVVLTIFAANAFDPRLMWDAAGLNGVRASARPLESAAEPALDRKAARA